MLLIEYNEKVRAIKIPENYEDFKKKVKEEYSLPDEKLSQIFFTYFDEEDNSIYVDNEQDFLYALQFIENIIFNIEFKENENTKKESSIDSLLLKGNIDDIIERANKRIIELKKEKNENRKLRDGKRNFLVDKNEKEDVIIHEGIKCNKCGEGNIKGIRYKCCICPNYNLCEKCENEYGLEHYHPLLKIRKPELCPINFYCKFQNHQL